MLDLEHIFLITVFLWTEENIPDVIVRKAVPKQ